MKFNLVKRDFFAEADELIAAGGGDIDCIELLDAVVCQVEGAAIFTNSAGKVFGAITIRNLRYEGFISPF